MLMKIKKRNRTTLAVVFAIILIVALLAIWFFFHTNSSSRIGADDINYSPATKDDKQLNDQIKQDLPEKDESSTPQQPSSAINSVKPVVSAWGQPAGPGTDFHLNGFVDGIVELDGECTLTLEQDWRTVTATKRSLQNAQNTSCGQMVTSYTKLTPGAWKATLYYASSTSKGASDPVTVQVQ